MHTAMLNHIANQDSLYDPQELAFHPFLRPQVNRTSKCGHSFKKTVSFDDKVKHIADENIVTYVDFVFCVPLQLEALTKLERISRWLKNYSTLSENTACIPINDQHTYILGNEISSNIYITRNFFSTWSQQLFITQPHPW